jgi:DNA-binding transcriptional LysR family regulator
MDDRLHKFSVLVEVGNFTRAAEELHISQPALSIAIDKLERELGTELLIRDGRHMIVTEGGKAALEAAEQLRDTSRWLTSELRRLAHKQPIVSIGMTDSIASAICSSRAFNQLDDCSKMTVVVNNSRYLRDATEKHKLDVAFIIDDGAEYPFLHKEPYGAEQLVLVCNPSRKKIIQDALKQGVLPAFISYDRPSTTYRHIQNYFQSHLIKPQTILYSTSPDVMLQMVQAGKGTAVLPKRFIETARKNKLVSVIAIPGPGLSRPICAIRLKGQPLAPEIQKFLGSIKPV